MSGFEVQIVAAQDAAMPALRTNVGAEMAFVRTFVGRETRVAIDAKQTLFRFEVAHRVVEPSDVRNEPSRRIEQMRTRRVVTRLVGLKPRTHVVVAQIGQKRQYFAILIFHVR